MSNNNVKKVLKKIIKSDKQNLNLNADTYKEIKNLSENDLSLMMKELSHHQV